MAVHLKALLIRTQLLHPNEVEDQTCPVCYEKYLQDSSRELPRKLPCGHIIGTECLLLFASSQAHATSINCPWCTRPIVDAIGAQYFQYLQTMMSGYLEAAVVHIGFQVQRVINPLDRTFREHPASCVFLAIVLAVLFAVTGLYFNTLVAWIPFGLLCFVLKEGMRDQPLPGAFLIALGFFVATNLHRVIGHWLIVLGEAPFDAAVEKINSDHPWLVSGAILLIGVEVLMCLEDPAAATIIAEAMRIFCLCLYDDAVFGLLGVERV